jgi:hypothetical protein
MTARELLRRLVPRGALAAYDAMRGPRPLHPRTCPICSYQGWFTHFGQPPRVDAQCPRCGSLERHRLFWLWYQRNGMQEPILHFAPEAVLRGRLLQAHAGYRTTDVAMPGVDLTLNIEKIDLPTASVQTILCNHVLEHVDDAKALAELFRILAPGGLLVCSVPIIEGWDVTYEVPAITDPKERLMHYGQDDHVRYYGRDFRDRVRAAGFGIVEFTAEGPDVVTYGLMRGDKQFICRKP